MKGRHMLTLDQTADRLVQGMFGKAELRLVKKLRQKGGLDRAEAVERRVNLRLKP